MSHAKPSPRIRLTAVLSACAIASALATTSSLLAPVAAGAAPAATRADFTAAQVRAEVRPAEVRTFGRAEAEYLAWGRLEYRAAQRQTAKPGARRDEEEGPDNGYPDPLRTRRLEMLKQTQAATNSTYDPQVFGRFTDYFSSPDYGDHIALLPTGKVLLFSFEAIQTDPTQEPAPTNIIGARNAGRAYLWDPKEGTKPSAFKAVPPPVVDLPDGRNAPRPAP